MGSDEADAKLQDYFSSTDWNMFWDYSDGIEEYTTSVTGFINKVYRGCHPHSECTYIPQPEAMDLQATFALC